MAGRISIRCVIAALAVFGMVGCSSGPNGSSPDTGTGGDTGGDTGGTLACAKDGLPACGAYTDQGGVFHPDSKCCAANEMCDRSVKGGNCIPVCNDGGGCAGTDTCDAVTKTCVAMKCNGTQCYSGQTCVDPTKPGTALSTSTTCGCIPASGSGATAIVDSCAAYGRTCDYVTGSTTPGRCQLPGFLKPCTTRLGCQTGMDCMPVTEKGVTANLCLPSCTTSADCKSADGKCYASGAYANHCYRADCSNYLGLCDFDGVGDGTCIPIFTTDGSSSPLFGNCEKNGPSTNTTCDLTNPMAKLCPAGTVCVDSGLTAAGNMVGNCLPLCNGGAGQPTLPCDNNSICFQWDTDSPNTNASVGVCFPKCNIKDGNPSSCSDGMAGNKNICRVDGLVTPAANTMNPGFCYPAAKNAALFGATCDGTASFESPYPCGGDDSVCLGLSAAAGGPVCKPLCTVTASCPLLVPYDKIGMGQPYPSTNPTNPNGYCDQCRGLRCAASTVTGDACTPNCAGKDCGSDGCGGFCGVGGTTGGAPLTAPSFCDSSFHVQTTGTCTPNCGINSCGNDGCGHACGTCGGTDHCIVFGSKDLCRNFDLEAPAPKTGAMLGTCG